LTKQKSVKLVLMRGIPGSGKSTKSKAMVAKDPNSWVRINRDDFRFMINDYFYGNMRVENLISKATHRMAEDALRAGFNVISDDMNLRQKYVTEWHNIAEKIGNITVVEKYMDITLKEALKRDLTREKKVGADVVKNQFNKYVKNMKIREETYYPPVDRAGQYIVQDESLPRAVICDIDGTAALMNGKRGPFEWHNVFRDDVNKPVEELIKIIQNSNDFVGYGYELAGETQEYDDVKMIYLSGRDGAAKDETIRWFKEKMKIEVVYGDNLFMRAPNDQRKDSIIKQELYDAHIRGQYNVLFVLDDRNQVVDNWRQEIGLPTFQVEYGDF
jgi:predicted kinase